MKRDAEQLAQREGWQQAQLTAEKDFVGSTRSPALNFNELIRLSRNHVKSTGKHPSNVVCPTPISIITWRSSNRQHIGATVEILGPTTA